MYQCSRHVRKFCPVRKTHAQIGIAIMEAAVIAYITTIGIGMLVRSATTNLGI